MCEVRVRTNQTNDPECSATWATCISKQASSSAFRFETGPGRSERRGDRLNSMRSQLRSAIETHDSQSEGSTPVQKCSRVVQLRQAERPTLGNAVFEQRTGDQCRSSNGAHHACAVRGISGNGEHDGLEPTVDSAPDLDANSPGTTVGVWRAQHRQSRRQPVSPGGGDPGGNAACIGKGALEQQWRGQSCFVRVSGPDRGWKPHEVSPAPPSALEPHPVDPVPSITFHGSVVLAGARRTTRPGLGHSNLGDLVETVSGVACQHTGQPRRHAGADHNGYLSRFRRCVEVEQITNIVQRVAERHHAHATLYRCTGDHAMSARRCGQHQHTRLAQQFLDCSMANDSSSASGAEGHGSIEHLRTCVVDVHHARRRLDERTQHMRARCPKADNGHIVGPSIVVRSRFAAHRRSEPVTSRHPSVCGGTPPVPRIRNSAATIPVIDSAATTRRTSMNIWRP